MQRLRSRSTLPPNSASIHATIASSVAASASIAFNLGSALGSGKSVWSALSSMNAASSCTPNAPRLCPPSCQLFFAPSAPSFSSTVFSSCARNFTWNPDPDSFQ
eukprot:1368286-Rhodomonas_salina.2